MTPCVNEKFLQAESCSKEVAKKFTTFKKSTLFKKLRRSARREARMRREIYKF